ncbi:hypothetical protein PIB30_072024 [Stylosanthes scabra]|uniref:Uncharacterized protein n=1 Tax=Stylosanthes scabra TaxID=79078 RepID=A0ABU6YPH6_9FABA|nr:hypothetical protein [Stylosanthes scabra]
MFNVQNPSRVDSSSSESILRVSDKGGLQADDPTYSNSGLSDIVSDKGSAFGSMARLTIMYMIEKRNETPKYMMMIKKNVNVRGIERGVLGKLRPIVMPDIYWIGWVGYDNRPDELILAIGIGMHHLQSLYRTENPVVWILTPYCSHVFQTAGGGGGSGCGRGSGAPADYDKLPPAAVMLPRASTHNWKTEEGGLASGGGGHGGWRK